MKRTLLLISLLCAALSTVQAEQMYKNDKYHFAFTVPDNCQVIEDKAEDKSAAYFVYNNITRATEAYISYQNTYEKDKVQDYRKLRKNVLANNDSVTIIDEKPFYDLLRQDLQYTYDADGERIYTKVMIKASSYIRITCYYPLSDEAQTVIDSFDNQTTFRGDLIRVKQNTGSIMMCIYLSLLCFVGYRARNKEKQWLYILVSIILLILPIIGIWANTSVMLFVLGVSLCIWLFFFSHNKILMWLIDSIF